MKKIYIRPVAGVEALEQTDIMAGSGSVIVDDYSGRQDQYGIDTNLEEGDGSDFAKLSFEYSLDIEPL